LQGPLESFDGNLGVVWETTEPSALTQSRGSAQSDHKIIGSPSQLALDKRANLDYKTK